jgi:hypothetical protein
VNTLISHPPLHCPKKSYIKCHLSIIENVTKNNDYRVNKFNKFHNSKKFLHIDSAIFYFTTGQLKSIRKRQNYIKKAKTKKSHHQYQKNKSCFISKKIIFINYNFNTFTTKILCYNLQDKSKIFCVGKK